MHPDTEPNLTLVRPPSTATTRHLVDLTVAVEGVDGIDPEYLATVIAWGIDQHNRAVDKLHGDKHGDLTIELVDMPRVTPSLGLGLENVMVREDNNSDPMEMPLSEVHFYFDELNQSWKA